LGDAALVLGIPNAARSNMKRKAHELLVDLSVARPSGDAEANLVVSLLRVVEAAEDGEELVISHC
jgi:hypothetical protein